MSQTPPRTKILLVEDDEALAQLLVNYLRRQQYEVVRVADGASGADLLLKETFDLCILDWQLPNLSGVEICARARSHGLTLPVILLTSRSSTEDTVFGLNTGADDYLKKPFEIEELAVRIQALLRRPKKVSGNEIQCGDVVVSLSDGRAYKSGKLLDLAPNEYAVLEFLMRNQGKIFTAEELLDRVWASKSDATFTAVVTSVKRLRQKLEQKKGDSIIKTVHGVGYKLEN
jgi:DNA-binding response OmpR family regulator